MIDRTLDLSFSYKVPGIFRALWESVTARTPDYTREELYVLLKRIFTLDDREFCSYVPLVLAIIKDGHGPEAFQLLSKEAVLEESIIPRIREPYEIRYLVAYVGPDIKHISRVMFSTKLSEMPLHAFSGCAQTVAQWRLEIGK